MSRLATTPEPPYYAAVFSSLRSEGDSPRYESMAARMLELAADQPGFLGVESVRDADGLGITVSYWQDREAIQKWQEHAEHQVAQELGRTRWYSDYRLRICLVEKESSTSRNQS